MHSSILYIVENAAHTGSYSSRRRASTHVRGTCANALANVTPHTQKHTLAGTSTKTYMVVLCLCVFAGRDVMAV